MAAAGDTARAAFTASSVRELPQDHRHLVPLAAEFREVGARAKVSKRYTWLTLCQTVA
jgi:hypothetical protein